jgi:sugar lactone lactonase YvrE/predicted small secreted protein
MKMRGVPISIVAVMAFLITACSSMPGSGSSSSSQLSSAGAAIGWIGGGTNGWQTGSAPASGSNNQSFNSPYSVFIDNSGNIYVADENNNRICKWGSNGAAIGWIGGGTNGWQTGSTPAPGSNYQSFVYPRGVYVDSSGNIYVADYGNCRICKWNSNGVAIGWIGGGINGWQTGASLYSGEGYQSFSDPSGVYVDGSGNIYVADWDNNRICKWNSVGVAIGWIGGAENGWQTGYAPSAGADYQSFSYPAGVYVDSSGNIYVADEDNNRICKWSSNGTAIGWLGGAANGWQTGQAPSAEADYKSFIKPYSVCVDSSGNIYVADSYNNRVCKWSVAGTAIGWLGDGANGWQTGYAGVSGGSDYQSFNLPAGVYVDSSGNIYVADSQNNRICKWH